MSYDIQQTVEYYNQTASTYDKYGYEEEGAYYPANLYRLHLAQSVLAGLPKGRIFDAGCGTGQFLVAAVEQGFEAAGCDVSAGMLDRARDRLRNVGADVPLFEAALEDLSMIEDDSFDHVFALGVFPYVPEEQEERAYHELTRVLRPGGCFVSAHENEIFDLFTMNKYTLRFYERNALPLIRQANPDFDGAAAMKRLATLMVNPDLPQNKDPKRSGRDIIFTRPENPLLYADKLARFGLESLDRLYYHYHALPPLIRNDESELIEASKRLEIKYARAWQGVFLASTFIDVARLTPG